MKTDQTKLGMLYSGGKDSTYSLGKLLFQNSDVACLITIFSENKDSFMLHTQAIEMTRLCSEALNLPLVIGHTKGEKEVELKDIKQTILEARGKYGINEIGTGAISSQYQKSRIELIGTECGLRVKSPIWGVNQRTYMRSLINEFYKFILTSVSCEGLDETWLGRQLTISDVEKLDKLSTKFRFNIAFEGGEAETLVLDCPLYKKKKIRIVDSEVEWNGYYGSLSIKKASLEDKVTSDKVV
jgi:diphthine-ammonia ligase